MVVGSATIFASLSLINRGAELPKDSGQDGGREMEVAPPPPPPPPEMERSRPEPQAQPQSRGNPPPPGLGSDLGGVDVGLGGFDMDEMGDMSQQREDEGELTMTGDTVDQPPVARERDSLPYPAEAKRKGVTGYVLLNLLINARGEVEQVQVLEAEPQGVFEEAARQAAKDWRFTPARYEGRDVRVWAQQRIRFDLS